MIHQLIRMVRRFAIIGSSFLPLSGFGQNPPTDSVSVRITLDEIINYSIEHQPELQQAKLDEDITRKAIKGKLADWYPQINLNVNYQYNFHLPTSIIGENLVQLGVKNTSAIQLNATQNLFNKDLLLAATTESTILLQTQQLTSRSKIDLVVNVTKAFYDVLTTTQKIRVAQEDIIRLARSLEDTHNQLDNGVSDKTDYKRATISLLTAKATLKTNEETLKYKEEYLKKLMGFPSKQTLMLSYDTLQMEREVLMDTVESMDYARHIDYNILQSQRDIQQANIRYSRWSFIPNVFAYGSYIQNYQNNGLDKLYKTNYENTFAGVALVFPVFQGGKRVYKVQEQKRILNRIDYDVHNLENQINVAYTRALASYKSNFANYQTLKQTVILAREVYDVVRLQYLNGIKTYLDVTITETDLRSARLNYFNALYLVLASKMDVQRALGQIN